MFLLFPRFYTHPDLQCALHNFDHELGRFYSPGTGLRPTLDKLITPWAGIETSWMQEPGSLRLLCNESIPGNLYLSPAPGEQFDLTIQLADQLLSYVASTIYLEVEHEVDEPLGVLIQLNGIQYAYNDRYEWYEKYKLSNFDNGFHSIHTDSALYFSFPPSFPPSLTSFLPPYFSPSFPPSFLPSLFPSLTVFLSGSTSLQTGLSLAWL